MRLGPAGNDIQLPQINAFTCRWPIMHPVSILPRNAGCAVLHNIGLPEDDPLSMKGIIMTRTSILCAEGNW
jgi:hypothetical protein